MSAYIRLASADDALALDPADLPAPKPQTAPGAPGPLAADWFRRLARDLTCVCDAGGVLRWTSAGWQDELGHQPADLIGRHFAEFIHPDDLANATVVLAAAMDGRPPRDLENRFRTSNGDYRWLIWTWAADPDDNLLYAVARDITDRKVIEMQLAESEARYRLLAEHSTDAITVASGDGRFDYVSPAGMAVFGWPPAELLGRFLFDFIHADDITQMRADLQRMLSDTSPIAITARFRRSDGSYRWLESTGRQIRDRISGDLLAVIGTSRDVTDRMTAQDAMLARAETDPLTGTANRRVLRERTRQALQRLTRVPGAVALLLLDLDRFKSVNDTLGHHTGDEVLIAVAQRLVAACRPTDSVARLGGDEFVVLAEGLDAAEDVHVLADRFVSVLREPFEVTGSVPGDRQALPLTVSVGVAVTSSPEQSYDDLMRDADLALYRAKDRGRNRHELYDEELQARTQHRLGTHQKLLRALAEDDLYLLYQPVVRFADGKVTGAESLLRIRDETGFELLPADFLTVAEDTGLIRAIDAWVLARTLTDQASFRQLDPTVFLGINLSHRNVTDGSFAETITAALSAAGLPGEVLHVELTERALRDASGPAAAGVQRLRAAGVKVGLDDFGTGRSSLSALQRIPLDFLKIDPQLVQDAVTGSRRAGIVGSVVGLAHALDLEVIAEGIESAAHLASMRALGCDAGQGWHFGPAVPAEGYRRLLAQSPAVQR